jgi:spermidine/putrescine-binding protein
MNKAFWQGLLLTISGSLALAACGGNATTTDKIVTSSGFECPAPRVKTDVQSKELNLFVWTEYIPTDHIECFEKIYNVTVQREEYSNNEEMYAKLSSGSSSYDLVQPTDYIMKLMISQNLVQKLDKTKLDILIKDIDPSYLNLPFDPNNEYTLPYQAGTYAIVVNSDKVDVSKITKWADLWNPEYAGRLVFLDDMRATIGLTLLTLGYDLNTIDEAQLAEAKAKLAELVPGIKLFDSDSPKSALIAGDVDLGMTWTGEARLAQKELPSIQYIYPSDGTIFWQDNYAIPTSASHLDATYAWLNYTMQPDMFWKMLAEYPYNMPSKGTLDYAQTAQADLYQSYMGSNITNVPAEIKATGHYLTDVGAATPLYDRIWTEVKGQ